MPRVYRKRTFRRKRSVGAIRKRRAMARRRALVKRRYTRSTLTLRRPRTLLPRKMRVVANMCSGATLQTPGGQVLDYYAVYDGTMQLNNLDWWEDNGWRSLNLERVANLYSRYKVNAIKFTFEATMNSGTQNNLMFYVIAGYEPQAGSFPMSSVIGSSALTNTANEIPNLSQTHYMYYQAGNGITKLTRYYKFKDLVGNKADWTDVNSWGGDVVHGALDHWSSPANIIWGGYGIYNMGGGPLSGGLVIGSIRVMIKAYVTLYAPNMDPAAA